MRSTPDLGQALAGAEPSDVLSPAGATLCAPAVLAYGPIQSLRLMMGYNLLACLLADTQLTDHIPVAVRIIRLEIVQ